MEQEDCIRKKAKGGKRGRNEKIYLVGNGRGKKDKEGAD